MSTKGTPTWLSVVWVAAGVLLAAGFSVYLFVSTMTQPLHPKPDDVPSVVGTPADPNWASEVERARQFARAALVDHNLPGLSVAVGVEGQFVWAEGFGWADLEKRVPVSPRMRFRIGHASKTLTSAAVGVLLEQERMRLGDEIQTYVPAYPRKDWPVTLRQLMGHMAGVRHYRGKEDYTSTTRCERASEGLAAFADDPLLFEPETQYAYSTYGWVLVSAAVESVAGQPFFTFMRQQVLDPTGMTDTTVDSGPEPLPNRVTFYYPRFSGDPATGSEPADRADYSCLAGAGAFLSTPSDLVRFGLALDSGKLLKRNTVAKLQSPQLLASGKETEYGLGWMLNTAPLADEPAREVGHSSLTLLGSSASLVTFPERRMVIAVMTNTSRARTRWIGLKIAEIFARR